MSNGLLFPLTRASLQSADAQYALDFVLRPIRDRRHEGWLTYELHLTTQPASSRWSLVSTEERPLFLDRADDPEIPAICAAFRRAASTGESFDFSPADELDFRLGVTTEPGGLRVRLQFDREPAPARFGWPGGVLVSRERAVRFAEDLVTAYRQLAD